MIWIKDENALQPLCDDWSQQSAIAIDTEFERSTTFYPTLALLQVSDSAHQHYLIDALTIPHLPNHFIKVLQSPAVKVLHACQEDMEIFSYWNGGEINSVFDTQIAAAYAGLGSQISYQSLVKQLLDMDLDKSQTRTDWLQRPLTEAQQKYAVEDVQYLLPCYEALIKKLNQQGRLAWLLEDCRVLLKPVQQPLPDEYYLTLKSAWFFNAQQLAALKAIGAWREDYIRQQNMPRSFVLKDGSALAMAEKIPQTQRAVREFLDYRSQSSRIEAALLNVIQQAINSVQQGELPECIEKPITLQKKFKPLLQQLKAAALEIARQMDLPDMLILRQKWLEKLVSAYLAHSMGPVDNNDRIAHLPMALQGWRYEKVVQPLHRLFEQWQRGYTG